MNAVAVGLELERAFARLGEALVGDFEPVEVEPAVAADPGQGFDDDVVAAVPECLGGDLEADPVHASAAPLAAGAGNELGVVDPHAHGVADVADGVEVEIEVDPGIEHVADVGGEDEDLDR